MSVIVDKDSIFGFGCEVLQPILDLIRCDNGAWGAIICLDGLAVLQCLLSDVSARFILGLHNGEVDFFAVFGDPCECQKHLAFACVDGATDASIVSEQNQQGVYLLGAASDASRCCFLTIACFCCGWGLFIFEKLTCGQQTE